MFCNKMADAGFKIFVVLSIILLFVSSILPFCLVLVATLAAVLLSDADLTLWFSEKFGAKPHEALRGKVVWITGASSGIGEHLAYKLSEAGAKLILSARRVEELERVKEKCIELSPQDYKTSHKVLKMDMLEMDAHVEHVEEAYKVFNHIDCLVNNAGRSQRAMAVDTTVDVSRAVLELNTVATISLTKAVLPQMMKRKSGLIVNISSLAGKLGNPVSAIYSASKHALHGYFDSLRMELSGSGIDILNVCPGPVESNVGANSFGGELEETPKVGLTSAGKGYMSTPRCAHLICVAMANRLHEVWISKNPFLLFTYLSQYTPGTAKWVGQWIGPRRVRAFKEGHENLFEAFLTWKK